MPVLVFGEERVHVRRPLPSYVVFFSIFKVNLQPQLNSVVTGCRRWALTALSDRGYAAVYYQHVARCNCPLTVESIQPGVGDAVSHCAVVPEPPDSQSVSSDPAQVKGMRCEKKHELL